MRVLFVHPNYHSGGAEIAGNWPPAWVACLSGALKANGFTDVTFIDAMTNDIGEDALRAMIAEADPDIVASGCDGAPDASAVATAPAQGLASTR